MYCYYYLLWKMYCEVTDLSQPTSAPTHPLCYDVYAVITVQKSMTMFSLLLLL